MKCVRLAFVAAAVAAAVPTAVSASAPPSTAPDDAAATFPVTIEHRYGSTTLDAPPERIVSLDDQWTDVLTLMEAPLVAAVETSFTESGRYPWQEDALADTVEPITATDSIPFEMVAAADPDLIVITYYATDQAVYDQLNEIAPTIGPLGEAQVDRWQDLAVTAGRVLDAADTADRLIDDAAQHSADLLAELPALEGLEYALANYVPGDAIYVVTDPHDGASQVFAELGMSIDADLLELAGGEAGRVEISLEQIGLLDADVLLLLTNGADPGDIPGFDALPAAQTGAYAILDLSSATGLNTPSPLSVPYALDIIRPALEAAAAAAG